MPLSCVPLAFSHLLGPVNQPGDAQQPPTPVVSAVADNTPKDEQPPAKQTTAAAANVQVLTPDLRELVLSKVITYEQALGMLESHQNSTELSSAEPVPVVAEATKVDSEVESEVDSEVAPEVDSEVAPEVDSEVTPEVDSEVAPEIDVRIGDKVQAKYKATSKTWKNAKVVATSTNSEGGMVTVRFEGYSDFVQLPRAQIRHDPKQQEQASSTPTENDVSMTSPLLRWKRKLQLKCVRLI